MKKLIVSFCPDCRRKTKHNLVEVKNDESMAERIYSAIFSFGLSEAMREPTGIYECEKCGNFKNLPKSWT